MKKTRNFSHFTPKKKKDQEDLAMYEYLFLMSAYEWAQSRTSPIADDGDHDRLLLKMGKFYGILRNLVEK